MSALPPDTLASLRALALKEEAAPWRCRERGCAVLYFGRVPLLSIRTTTESVGASKAKNQAIKAHTNQHGCCCVAPNTASSAPNKPPLGSQHGAGRWHDLSLLVVIALVPRDTRDALCRHLSVLLVPLDSRFHSNLGLYACDPCVVDTVVSFISTQREAIE